MKIKDGQTLQDLAVEEFGAWEAAMDIALQNGMSITDVPDAGTDLQMPDKTYNKTMQVYCQDNDVSPATAKDQSGVPMKIFTEEFTEQFK